VSIAHRQTRTRYRQRSYDASGTNAVPVDLAGRRRDVSAIEGNSAIEGLP